LPATAPQSTSALLLGPLSRSPRLTKKWLQIGLLRGIAEHLLEAEGIAGRAVGGEALRSA